MRGRWLGCERSECLSRRGWRAARTLTKSSGATTLPRDFAPALHFPSGLVRLLSLPREEKVLLLEQDKQPWHNCEMRHRLGNRRLVPPPATQVAVAC